MRYRFVPSPYAPIIALAAALAFALGAFAVSPSATAAEPSGEVKMSLQRYERLMATARQGDGPQPTWSRASVQAQAPSVVGAGVRVEVRSTVKVVGTGLSAVPLLPADVVLEAAQLGGAEATLVRRAGAHVALLESARGDQSVYLRYVVPVRETRDGGRAAVVPLPPVPGAALTVNGVTDDADVWPAAELQQRGSQLQASLPGVAAVVVRWAGEGGAHRVGRVDYRLVVKEAIDAADVVATFRVVLNGETADVPVVSLDTALMDVREDSALLPTRTGDGWHLARVSGKGEHIITVRFRVPIDRTAGQPQAALQLTAAPITSVTADVPGERDVRFDPVVPLELSRTGENESVRTVVTGYLPPIDGVTVRWTEPRPSEELQVRVNTETYQVVTIQEGVLRSKVVLNYQVLRGKTKELVVELPDGVVLYRVQGEGIEDWRTFAPTEDKPRQVRVSLGRELDSTYALELQLEMVIPKTEGAPLPIPVVRPQGVFRETGVVALLDGDKVGFAPAEQTTYTKVGEDALPADVRQALPDRVSQAFKHIGAPGNIRSRVAAAKEREIRFDARVETLFHVKEGALVGQATILIEFKSGRQDVVRLSIPENVNVIDVTASSLNRHEQVEIAEAGEGRKGYEVRFTRALEGAVQIYMEVERLLDKEPGAVALPDIRVLGAEVEEGAFGVTSDPGVEVQARDKGELRQIPIEELPNSVRLRSPREVLMGFRYARAPWALEVDIKRHKTVETLKAVIERAWLETAVLGDGHIVTRALYRVRNQDQVYMRLAMPEGKHVWSVKSNGTPTEAVADESGVLAIELLKDQTQHIEVIYEIGYEPFDWMGSIALSAPHADLVVTGLVWMLRVPPRYALSGVETALEDAELIAWDPPNAGTSALPLDTNTLDEMDVYVFGRAVHDPGEKPLDMAFSLIDVPQEPTGLFVLLALLLLAPVAARVARRRPLAGASRLLLGLGVLVLVAKAILWGFWVSEAAAVIIGLVAVSVVSWLIGRRAEEETA